MLIFVSTRGRAQAVNGMVRRTREVGRIESNECMDDVGGWVMLEMSIQSFSYPWARCMYFQHFCWAAKRPGICGVLKVSLSLVGRESLTSKYNVMLAWPGLAFYCLQRNGKQLEERSNALTLRAETFKWKESPRFEQGKEGVRYAECALKKVRAAGTQYRVYSNYSARVEHSREETGKTALQTMNRTSGEGNFVEQSTQVAMLRNLEAALGSAFDSGPQAPSPKPLVIVISGPSGVGKDAVINRLQEVRKGIHFVVTATTRVKRPGEVEGKDYYFVGKQEFLSMIEKNELLEYALVYGDYKGIPKQQIRDFMSKGFDIVLRVDVQGAATLRSILGNSALFIFLVAESEAALVRRLMQRRTETMDKLLVRISTAREEVKRMSEFDYVAVNAEGQLERTVNLICSIIDAEKARVQQRTLTI